MKMKRRRRRTGYVMMFAVAVDVVVFWVFLASAHV
jgi:predicted nucleic acid-binding Zn ribbon protein